MPNPFDFLDHLVELENKIAELESLSDTTGLDMGKTIQSLRDKLESESRRTFDALTPWQRVLLARHPLRPQVSDYVDHMVEDWVPLSGDRSFAEDEAIMCGLGRIDGIDCVIVGQQKGKDVHERIRCNLGRPRPEGYRKAMLKMRMAEKFDLPVVTFINTPGAWHGIEAEERGQAIAIAENIRDMAQLRVPVVVVVIGEGGSGGALGIGVGDRILMLENSYYSVIAPEGCAAILWKDGSKADQAADTLRLTAQSLRDFGIVDEIVPEPAGGSHRHPDRMSAILREAIVRHLRELLPMDRDELLERRYAKFRAIGEWTEA